MFEHMTEFDRGFEAGFAQRKEDTLAAQASARALVDALYDAKARLSAEREAHSNTLDRLDSLADGYLDYSDRAEERVQAARREADRLLEAGKVLAAEVARLDAHDNHLRSILDPDDDYAGKPLDVLAQETVDALGSLMTENVVLREGSTILKDEVLRMDSHIERTAESMARKTAQAVEYQLERDRAHRELRQVKINASYDRDARARAEALVEDLRGAQEHSWMVSNEYAGQTVAASRNARRWRRAASCAVLVAVVAALWAMANVQRDVPTLVPSGSDPVPSQATPQSPQRLHSLHSLQGRTYTWPPAEGADGYRVRFYGAGQVIAPNVTGRSVYVALPAGTWHWVVWPLRGGVQQSPAIVSASVVVK